MSYDRKTLKKLGNTNKQKLYPLETKGARYYIYQQATIVNIAHSVFLCTNFSPLGEKRLE